VAVRNPASSFFFERLGLENEAQDSVTEPPVEKAKIKQSTEIRKDKNGFMIPER
jgi:hypothetical protein